VNDSTVIRLPNARFFSAAREAGSGPFLPFAVLHQFDRSWGISRHRECAEVALPGNTAMSAFKSEGRFVAQASSVIPRDGGESSNHKATVFRHDATTVLRDYWIVRMRGR
jgi:hypothetical protein